MVPSPHLLPYPASAATIPYTVIIIVVLIIVVHLVPSVTAAPPLGLADVDSGLGGLYL